MIPDAWVVFSRFRVFFSFCSDRYIHLLLTVFTVFIVDRRMVESKGSRWSGRSSECANSLRAERQLLRGFFSAITFSVGKERIQQLGIIKKRFCAKSSRIKEEGGIC